MNNFFWVVIVICRGNRTLQYSISIYILFDINPNMATTLLCEMIHSYGVMPWSLVETSLRTDCNRAVTIFSPDSLGMISLWAYQSRLHLKIAIFCPCHLMQVLCGMVYPFKSDSHYADALLLPVIYTICMCVCEMNLLILLTDWQGWWNLWNSTRQIYICQAERKHQSHFIQAQLQGKYIKMLCLLF